MSGISNACMKSRNLENLSVIYPHFEVNLAHFNELSSGIHLCEEQEKFMPSSRW